MQQPPFGDDFIQQVLRQRNMRRITNQTVVRLGNQEAQVRHEVVTYRDPAQGLVTEETSEPFAPACGHIAHSPTAIGGQCEICGRIWCSDCLITCPDCGAVVCLHDSREWRDDDDDTTARYCMPCRNDLRRGHNRRRVLGALGWPFVMLWRLLVFVFGLFVELDD
ncbi:MAG: hypothetical protein GF320_18770 [Armatimonadia bacterium]|nr:hypothetical protein [Armatimonadia bacterium]